MARKPKDATGQDFQEDPPKPLSNSKVRAETIRAAAAEMARIDGEIAELREQKNAIKNEKIKSQLGMKMSDFNLALRLHKLEGDDRARAIDTFREAFEALAPGETLDMFPKQGGTPGLSATH